MENTLVTRVNHPKVPALSGTGAFIAGVFLTWLALILVLAARGEFAAPAGAPPLALLIGLLTPLSLFLLGYRTIPRCASLFCQSTFASLWGYRRGDGPALGF